MKTINTLVVLALSVKGPRSDDPRRIDWILTRGPVVADATQIITFSKNGQYPSDHFPVVAWLRFRTDAAK